MSKEKRVLKAKDESVPNSTEATVSEEQVPFVVVRGGLRVSDRDYKDANDPKALEEVAFWQRVVDRYPDGTKIGLVSYDKKKHRVW